MSNQAHKNRIIAKQEARTQKRKDAEWKRFEEDYDMEQRTLRRYGAGGKKFTGAYTNLGGGVVLTGPSGTAFARPIPPSVDMKHEARLRGMSERKARGTQSSSQRKVIK